MDEVILPLYTKVRCAMRIVTHLSLVVMIGPEYQQLRLGYQGPSNCMHVYMPT